MGVTKKVLVAVTYSFLCETANLGLVLLTWVERLIVKTGRANRASLLMGKHSILYEEDTVEITSDLTTSTSQS